MRCNDKLGALLRQLMHPCKQCHLPSRRKRGFRLIEEIQPFPAEPVKQQGEKTLAMRLMV